LCEELTSGDLSSVLLHELICLEVNLTRRADTFSTESVGGNWFIGSKIQEQEQ
jgi:hypothetical protein